MRSDKTEVLQNGRVRGKFAPGVSGNPAGRPEGSRNKATLAMQDLLLTEGGAVLRKAVELALTGNETAMKLIIERLLPVAKERAISLELPKLENPSDLAGAVKAAIDATASGEITTTEAESILRLLTALRTALESRPGDLQSEAFNDILKF